MSVEQLCALPWQWLIEREPQPYSQGLAGDEAWLDRVQQGEAVAIARIWRTQNCLVATRREARMPDFARACQTLAAQGWPVLVRRTGGACVPQGAGVWNLSLLYSRPGGSWSIDDSYRFLCCLLQHFFAELGLSTQTGEVAGSFCDGSYNLQIGGQKIVGTAQRWRSRAILAHACILVDVDLDVVTALINRLYRDCASAQQFRTDACTTLTECLSLSRSQRDALSERLPDKLREAIAGQLRRGLSAAQLAACTRVDSDYSDRTYMNS